jgi:DNA primase large subunit
VLVSLVDRPALVRRYADAEARTAHGRFQRELVDSGEYRSTDGDRLTLRELLAEFDLAGSVHGVDDSFALDDEVRIHVGVYLSLSAALEGDQWRLSRRRLADGLVPVTGRELLVLLREAVRDRVAEGLPFEDVPEPIATALAPQVERLRGQLGEHRPPRSVDTLVPELFPPCMTALAERALSGEALDPPASYALVAFLTSAGMTPEEVAAALPIDAAEYQAERLGSEMGGGYAPPTCATMQSYGDTEDEEPGGGGPAPGEGAAGPEGADADVGLCVPPADRDARCASVLDPLTYYAEALAAAEEVTPYEGGDDLAARLDGR